MAPLVVQLAELGFVHFLFLLVQRRQKGKDIPLLRNIHDPFVGSFVLFYSQQRFHVSQKCIVI